MNCWCFDSYEEGGFAGVQSIFPSSEFVPLDVSHGAYKPEEGINIHSIEEYKKFERALDTLERPTALVCKSARRAGAVYTAYSVRSLFHFMSYAMLLVICYCTCDLFRV